MTGSSPDLLLTLAAPDGAGIPHVTLSRVSDGTLLAEGEAASGGLSALPDPLAGFPESFPSEGALVALGRGLSGLALPPRVRTRLRMALAEMADGVGPVRLWLSAAGPSLAGLPWEFLHLGEQTGPEGSPDLCGFLGLHPRLRLVRAPDVAGPAPAVPGQPVPERVRVLLVHADPRTPDYPALPHLAAEVRTVRHSVDRHGDRAEILELERATPGQLHNKLLEWRPHILHLICHGDAPPTGGRFVLHGGQPGQSAFLYADDLAEWQRESPVRLAVLSACRTGAAGPLAAAGVPAVVAMQRPLRDAAAGQFARFFYTSLAESCPVEEALYEARVALQNSGPDWGVPVLTLSGPCGPVFPPVAPRPAAEAPARRPPPTPLPPTNSLYRPSDAFVGRDREMAELHFVLSGGRSAALIGMHALGKTQLAVEYAHVHRAAYPGGVYWVSGRTTDGLVDELADLGRKYFGAPEDWSSQEAADWARDALMRSPQPALLVCDDLAIGTDQRCLPPKGACRLLLTTLERRIVPRGFHQFILSILEGPTAHTLLGDESDAGSTEWEAAADIAEMVGGLPGALEMMGVYVTLEGLTFAEYRARLEASRIETLRRARHRLRTATRHDGALYEGFTLYFRTLSAEAAGVLTATAALGPQRAPADLLFEVWHGGTRDEFDVAVADLADGCLIRRGEDHTLTVHELYRAFTREQAPAAERTAGVLMAASVLTRRLTAALDGGDMDTVRAEAGHAVAVADQCRLLALPEALGPLLLPLGRVAFQAGRFAQARTFYDEGISLLSPPDDRRGEMVRFLNERAEARVYLQDLRGGLGDARAALTLARQVWGRGAPELAEYYVQVGLCLAKSKKYPRARRFYERALSLAEAAHGRYNRLVATCLNNLGSVAELQEDFDTALSYLGDALKISRAVSGPEAEHVGVTLNLYGKLLGHLGRWEEALASHREALAIHEKISGRQHPDVGRSLYYLGEAESALGRTAPGQDHYKEAHSIYLHFFGETHKNCLHIRSRITDL